MSARLLVDIRNLGHSGVITYLVPHLTEDLMTGKLTPDGEVIAAYGAAMVAAFQVLINCLEENDAVSAGTVS